MSKRKKQVYAVVVTVVGGALALDQLTGTGGPAPVAAQSAPATAVDHGMGSEAGGAPTVEATATWVLSPARFPPNLPAGRPDERDIFGLTAVARRALLQDPDVYGAAGDRPARAHLAKERRFLSPAERFKKRHTASAVVSSGAFTVAFVDGIWMVVGQRLDGCDLVRIDGHTVVFECVGEEVELSVEIGLLSVQGRPEDAAGDLKPGRSGVDTVPD